MHSTGIGGGGFMMVYDSHKRSAEMIDFRETAPEHSGVDLFKGDPLNGIRGKVQGKVKVCVQVAYQASFHSMKRLGESLLL